MYISPLSLALAAGIAGILFELLALAFKKSLSRRSLYLGSILFSSFSAVAILAYDLRLTTLIMAVIVTYRVFNSFRVTDPHMIEPRLTQVSRRTSRGLILFQVLVFGLWQAEVFFDIRGITVLYGLAILSLAASIVLLLSTRRNLRKSLIRSSDKYRPDSELPTVSVCIPARNETEDLPSCLSSIVASDYPKLEVLVLDDCSQDRTSEIIKGFARDGVRFIAGEPPAKGWLAKNQAYQMLAEAASGDIILFCGVDTRFEKQAIRSMVGSLDARKKKMISLLPKSLQVKHHSALIQPMRYWWELSLPRRLFNRPPVLSTVWMIRRKALLANGGINAVKGSVLPEAYFARELTKTDEYSFMRADGKLMIYTAKRLPDQWQSAIRTHYPRLRKRPENVAAISVLIGIFILLPISVFIAGFIVDLGLLWLLTGVNTLLLGTVHFMILRAWGVKDAGLQIALLPAAILSEIAVLQVSMWKYEFSKVNWKDRNICIPVMRHYARLPKI